MTIQLAGSCSAATATISRPAVEAARLNLMPQWMQDFAKFNPVNWAVEAGRQTLSSIDWSLVGGHLAGLLALTLVCAWLSTRAFRAYQRSV